MILWQTGKNCHNLGDLVSRKNLKGIRQIVLSHSAKEGKSYALSQEFSRSVYLEGLLSLG